MMCHGQRSLRTLSKTVNVFASPRPSKMQRRNVSQQDSLNAQLEFRTFIDVLRSDGDLAEINDEVDPELEIGAIIRRVSEVNARAPLFNNVKGASNGLWRMFGNAASLRANEKEKYGRVARNLGLPATATWKEILERTQDGKNKPLVAPVVLPDGSCKQNKLFGDEIDLHKLPVPLLHGGDGGRYIQTYGVHVLQTPDKSWTNWSIFRGMVHDSRRIVCLIFNGQHNSIIRDKWLAEGKDEIPWALALGVPPAANLAAALPVPTGISEAEYVGAMVGKPLELVKCELSDLLVPANSEIVVEGKFSLKDKAMEGPFEDFLGLHFEMDAHEHPLFRVDAITYRDNAILPVSVPGRITDESHTTASMASAEILTLCKLHGLPIIDAVAPLETMGNWCVLSVDIDKLAAMKTTPQEFRERVGNLVFNNKSSLLVNRLLLVGSDVDIYNFHDVIWAHVTRCRPGKDELVLEDVPGFPLTPYMGHGGHGDPRRGGKVVTDCLFPVEYEGKRTFSSVDFKTSYPEHIQKRVLERWDKMGLDHESK